MVVEMLFQGCWDQPALKFLWDSQGSGQSQTAENTTRNGSMGKKRGDQTVNTWAEGFGKESEFSKLNF